MPRVRICAGGTRQRVSLPRSQSESCATWIRISGEHGLRGVSQARRAAGAALPALSHTPDFPKITLENPVVPRPYIGENHFAGSPEDL